MTAAWNKRMIALLAQAFRTEVEAKRHLPLTLEDCPSLGGMDKKILKKLQAVQGEYNKQKILAPEEYTTTTTDLKAERRRNLRRNNVSLRFRRSAFTHISS